MSAGLAAMSGRFHFVRHGQTLDNQRGVRCGGDRDVALTERGLAEARAAATRFRLSGRPCGLIVAGPLHRTQVTAALFGEALKVPVIAQDWLRERALGAWNGLAIEDTRPWFEARLTPPGGESEEVFSQRVIAGLTGLVGLLPQSPLLVGSKGIGRILFTVLARQPRVELGNCELVTFDPLGGEGGPERWAWRWHREGQGEQKGGFAPLTPRQERDAPGPA
jgi:probable phosphoglycerate mutase